jgi:hypothetical protein
MENQKETLAALETSPATLPVDIKPAKKPESYQRRIRKMSAKQLRGEVRKQGRLETSRSNGEGIILATVLGIFLDSNKRNKSMLPR